MKSNSNIKHKKKTKKKYNIYCANCGKLGHMYKNCTEPITSFGMINIMVMSDETELIDNIIKKFDKSDKVLINDKGIQCESSNEMETFCKYKNNVKFLMIRRKHTLGYIEFVRGRYNIDNVDGIIFLFKQMIPEEIDRISKFTFDELWDELWGSNKNKQNFQNEYNISKQKFEKLFAGDDNFLSLNFYITQVKPNWNCPEWGFPKGRRNYQECDLDCGLREFIEETGYDSKEFTILDNIKPVEEIFIGTNGINYRHVYFLSISHTFRDPKLDPSNIHQMTEIGDIGWFSFEEAINIIRPYHTERKKILTEIYMHIINAISSINRIKNSSI